MHESLWHAVFGNHNPVEIEIGPGRGEVLLASAAAAPAVNFFAVERAAGRAEAILAKAAALALGNVRVVAADARCVLALVPTASVAGARVYFPDPWPKTRHRPRRLFGDGGLARDLGRTLAPGGAVQVATDLPALFEIMCMELAAAGLVRDPNAAPPAGQPTTSFERKYARAGTHYARFSKGSARGGRGPGAPVGCGLGW